MLRVAARRFRLAARWASKPAVESAEGMFGGKMASGRGHTRFIDSLRIEVRGGDGGYGANSYQSACAAAPAAWRGAVAMR